MTTSDWITLGAAILTGGGTLFLGIMAWRTIQQTRSIQKAEKRQRLLNEVIEWAIDILECVPEIIIPAAGAKGKDTMLGLTMFNLVLKYKSVDARTEYVKGIASTFGKSLESAVEIVSQQLTEVIKFVLSHPPDERSYDMVGGYTEPLSTSTVALIKTATKIKTRDIGKKEENMSKEGEATGGKEPTLKDIEEHLKRQDRQRARTQWQWLFNLGVSVMAVGLTWFIATTTQGILDFNGLFVFSLGLLIGILSLFYRYRKKS